MSKYGFTMKGAVFRSNGQGQIHLGVCSNLLQPTELERGQFPTDCQNTYGPYMFEMFIVSVSRNVGKTSHHLAS